MVVGYGMTSKMRLPAICSLVEEARLQARKNGRSTVAATDLRDAMLQYQIPSDQAMQFAFADPNQKLKGKSVSAPPARPLRERCTTNADDLQASVTTAAIPLAR